MRYQMNINEFVSDLIDNEIMLLNLRTGYYYNLETTAATIWQWLEAGASSEQVEQALCEAFPDRLDSIRSDLQHFLSDLTEQGILTIDSEGRPLGAVPPFSGDYQCPQLFTHSDMEELMKVDPVHEAGDSGWPTVAVH